MNDYQLAQDHAGNWFVVPAWMFHAWEHWLKEGDPAEVPTYAEQVSRPESVKFRMFRIETR